MARSTEPRIVAELGRPETPDETAARKAANSRNYRDSKTVRNLLVALGVSLVLVLGIALVVVRPDPGPPPTVDWHKAASDAGSSYLNPQLPDGWTANAAEVRGKAGEQYWYLGFITPDEHFIGVEQHTTEDADWVTTHGDKTALSAPTTTTAGGASWNVYRHTGEANSNYATVWESVGTPDQLLVYGTGTETELTTVATALERWTR